MLLRPLLRSPLQPMLRGPLDMRFTNIVSAVRGTFLSSDVGAFWSLRRETLFQDSAGTTPVTATGQTVGLVLDDRYALAVGSDIKSTGTVGLLGAATAATYNTSTGAGSVTRVDLSNQSFVTFTGLASNSTYRVMVTAVSNDINVRRGDAGNTVVANITQGTSRSVYVDTQALTQLTITSTGGTATFTLTLLQLVPGTHLYQTTAGSRPTYNQDANGANKLTLNGTTNHLVGTIGWTGTDLAMFAAVNTGATPAANEALIALGNSANITDFCDLRINTSAQGTFLWQGTSATGVLTLGDPALRHVVGFQADSKMTYVDLTTSLAGALAITNLNITNRISVGARVRSSVDLYFGGDFYGGWVRTRSPSTETRSTVIRGLASLARLSL